MSLIITFISKSITCFLMHSSSCSIEESFLMTMHSKSSRSSFDLESSLIKNMHFSLADESFLASSLVLNM